MKFLKLAAAGALALLASGCLLTPGRFNASLDLRRDGTFRYAYAGEIVFALPGPDSPDELEPPFDPDAQICRDEASDGDESIEGDPRDCTPEEIEAKRKEWEDGRETRIAQKKRENETARAMIGGIDPSDARTMDEFARRLQGQSGFKRVQHKGHGVFDVDYELSGRIDRDFIFPVFPDVDLIIPFVKVVRLSGNRVRVAAPAFVQPRDGFKAMGAMFQGDSASAQVKKAEGTFTVTTDAEIVTNNTQDGPIRAGTARTMRWTVGPLDLDAPETLLQL